MWIQGEAAGTRDARRIEITSCAEYARVWIARASKDDLVRVSRLLKHMCSHRQTGDDYEWSVEQIRRITGYTDDMPGDYVEFDDALRNGLREQSGDFADLSVCAVYRPGQAACETPRD